MCRWKIGVWMCGDGYEGRPDMYVARMSEDVGVKGVRMWV